MGRCQDATVVPNEEYKGGQKVANDGVKFVFYTDNDAAYADLLSGNLDLVDVESGVRNGV